MVGYIPRSNIITITLLIQVIQALDAIIQSPLITFPSSFLATYSVSGVPLILDTTELGLQPPSPPPNKASGVLQTGAIIGIAVGGGIGLLAIILVIAWVVVRKRRVKQTQVCPKGPPRVEVASAAPRTAC